jgi:S-adenosylmethionine hydrolase
MVKEKMLALYTEKAKKMEAYATDGTVNGMIHYLKAFGDVLTEINVSLEALGAELLELYPEKKDEIIETKQECIQEFLTQFKPTRDF